MTITQNNVRIHRGKKGEKIMQVISKLNFIVIKAIAAVGYV